MSRTRLLLVSSAISGVIGITLGTGIGMRVGTRTVDNFSLASEARYSRAMFCFAPADVALPSAETFLERVTTANQDELLQRDRVFAATAVALLHERLTSARANSAWQTAERACQATDYEDCSREWLTRLLTNACADEKKLRPE